ncbi:tetratricopeptide repeat protein [Holospora undulata]|uniref:Type IV pilus biogenesis and competence protein PilQ n=1 Tax=Holospora undulata HU1 TaxID=1321371 RepID=A0A061JH24_9PROT|nr:tetratricopeptide repeat protein [Holospora undulata]ETZ04567.1 type IV pilus biogenesis and competence protein PilQ [Holospora undulata HU1]
MRRSLRFFCYFWTIVSVTSCNVSDFGEHCVRKNLAELAQYHSELEKVWNAIEQDDLQKASKEMNIALQISPEKPVYHLINGLIYESIPQDLDQQGLSKAAYQAAYNLDPSHYLHAYLLGVSELVDRQYLEAQTHLTNALILNPKNPDIMYALAYASYHIKDLAVAHAMLKRALAVRPFDKKFLRGMAMICAAYQKFDEAKRYAKQYRVQKNVAAESADMLDQRICDWENAYRQVPKLTKIDDSFLHSSPSATTEPGASDASPENQAEDVTSIFFDCYSMQYQEVERALSGQNIMNVLQVVLGTDTLASVTRTLGRGTNSAWSSSGPVSGEWKKDFGISVSMSSLRYSLNLANAQKEMTSILARPSIHTVLTKKATLFSGENYTGGVSGSTGSAAGNIEAGISLEITPLSLSPEGVLTMSIQFSGSFFTDNPNLKAGLASQLLSITRSRVRTTVKAVIGQTVALGGIYTKQGAQSSNRTPILGDIPIVQYFFGSKQNSARVNSVIYLITARLGGSGQQLGKIERKKIEKARKAVHNQLKMRGLMSVGEFSNWYYIFGHLESSPLFLNFRSGDLETPQTELNQGTDLGQRLHLLARFLYF